MQPIPLRDCPGAGPSWTTPSTNWKVPQCVGISPVPCAGWLGTCSQGAPASSGPPARMGVKSAARCQLRAPGDGLCCFGVRLGCCQHLDPASRWRLGHTACSGGQGHPQPHVAAFLRLLTAPGTWLGQGIVPTSGLPGGQLGLGRRRRAETLEPVWFLSPSRPQTSLGQGDVAISVFAPAWFRTHGSCPVLSDLGITWLLPGDSEMPLGESLCTLRGCCGIR